MISYRDLCGPNPRPMLLSEAEMLMEVVRDEVQSYGIPVIVQIGADIGVSTVSMLTACHFATIFSVDRSPCEQELNNVKNAGLDPSRVIRLLGDSSSIGSAWPEEFKFPILFVDGDHREDGVRRDILAWRPHVKVGGYIAFHDYIPEPIPPEIKGRVVYAVDDLMRGYSLWGRVDRLIVFKNLRDV